MRIVYFLPKFNYFSEGLRGRTSHAHGFISGLQKNDIRVLLVSGPGYDRLYNKSELKNLVFTPKLISKVNILWVTYAAMRMVNNREINQEDSVLVVRYATSVSFLLSFLFGLFWKGKSIYEINSIGYHQIKSKSGPLLSAVLAVEKALISAFDIALCVSANICHDLESERIHCLVMPNGSSVPPLQLQNIQRAVPRFIYLGGFQPYYDFGQLFRCFLKAELGEAELHVYGKADMYAAAFPEYINHEAIRLMGNYDLGQLLGSQALSRIDIFVLPNGRNKMARIGSPTKLFEYLAFGSRIVYQDYGQAQEILSVLDSTYPYHDDASLTSTLDVLARQFNKEFRSPVTESEYNATYTWEARVKAFRKYIEETT